MLMTNLIAQISKYMMIILMAVYTYANFRFFSCPYRAKAEDLRQADTGYVRAPFSGLSCDVLKDGG